MNSNAGIAVVKKGQKQDMSVNKEYFSYYQPTYM